MPDKDPQFTVLMTRMRRKSEGAARELLEEYGPHLLRVVRRRLNKRLRTKFDSTDFIQSVWASFFALPADKMNFDQPEALAAFLGELARNKIVDVVRKRLEALKSGGCREASLDANAVCVVQEPSPLAIAIAREEWQRLLHSQSERDRVILTSIGIGNSVQQTASDVGVSRKTIQRVLGRVTRSKKPHER